MGKNDSFSNDKKTNPNDFEALNKSIKAELMDIVDSYGFKDAKELQKAIDSGKIKLTDIKERVGVILRQRFAEVFDKNDHKDLMQAIDNKEINFPEFYSFMSNFLRTINPSSNKNPAKTKHNIKPLSDG